MSIIIYPSQQVINTYLCIGFEVEMYISYDGETVIICSSDQDRPSQSFLAEKGYSDIDYNKFYKVYLSKDEAKWDFNCPINYEEIPDKLERKQCFYVDGMAKISTVLSRLNYYTTIRIPKNHATHRDCMIEFNSY